MDVKDTSTGKSIKKQNALKRFWDKFSIGAKKTLRIIVGRTIPQKLFRLYILTVIIGALLLAAPFCLQKIEIDGVMVQLNGFTNAGGVYNFWKALFIACSGFSDTGLTPVPIYTYLNTGGQVVLMILIEVGGIGIITLFYFVWNFFKKKDQKIDVSQLYIMQAERGGNKLADSWRVLKKALCFILLTQIVFMFIYSMCFCFIPAYTQRFLVQDSLGNNIEVGISFDDKTQPLGLYHNYGKSLWTGLFTTVSAMNNAGFDNISATSMAPYRNGVGTVLQLFIVLELIIGGLGHFVWFEVIEKIKCKALHKHYKMTLYSKVAISVYGFVALFGVGAALLTEFFGKAVHSNVNVVPRGLYGHEAVPAKELTVIGNTNSNFEFGHGGHSSVMYNKICTILFGSFNCRSLGMETIKSDYFVDGTKWIFCILMFIGASPCSTAGGIRTTTLAVIVVTIWCKLCGRKNVFFFKRRISNDTVQQSFIIFFISLLILLIGVAVLSSATPKPAYWEERQIDPNTWYGFSEYLMECASAFGTVGLSAGITAFTKWWGLLYLIFLMFVGQLGVINTLLSWTKMHPHFNDIEYPYEDIKIG